MHRSRPGSGSRQSGGPESAFLCAWLSGGSRRSHRAPPAGGGPLPARAPGDGWSGGGRAGAPSCDGPSDGVPGSSGRGERSRCRRTSRAADGGDPDGRSQDRGGPPRASGARTARRRRGLQGVRALGLSRGRGEGHVRTCRRTDEWHSEASRRAPTGVTWTRRRASSGAHVGACPIRTRTWSDCGAGGGRPAQLITAGSSPGSRSRSRPGAVPGFRRSPRR